MQTKTITTQELGVYSVEVVETASGPQYAGPFYFDQLELLRTTLRGMPRRNRHVVVVREGELFIHRREKGRLV